MRNTKKNIKEQKSLLRWSEIFVFISAYCYFFHVDYSIIKIYVEEKLKWRIIFYLKKDFWLSLFHVCSRGFIAHLARTHNYGDYFLLLFLLFTPPLDVFFFLSLHWKSKDNYCYYHHHHPPRRRHRCVRKVASLLYRTHFIQRFILFNCWLS